MNSTTIYRSRWGGEVEIWKCGGTSSERVAPAEAREAAEVGIVGMDLGLVLHGERGDVGIRNQVGSYAGRGEVTRKPSEVAGAGVDRSNVRKAEPCLYVAGRLIRRHRM